MISKHAAIDRVTDHSAGMARTSSAALIRRASSHMEISQLFSASRAQLQQVALEAAVSI